jgi:hypothetical protein
LTFSKATQYSATGQNQVDNDLALGMELAYGDSYWRWGDARIGWEFGFGWLSLNFNDSNPLSATLNRTLTTYSTGGITVPNAPYYGSANSLTTDLPGISATPSSTYTTTTTGTLLGSRKIDVSLFTFKLGPSVCFGLSPRLGLYVSGGPALGFVTGDYTYNETLYTSSTTTASNGKLGISSVVYGGYVNAVLAYNFPSEKSDIYIGVQYMPLGDTTVSAPGREARIDMSGQVTIMAGLNWPF